MIKIISFFIISNLLFINQLIALQVNEQGNPFITNYSYKEYKGVGQNWAITQDSRGVMYFGNGDKGVMEFDGDNFRFIPVANKSTVLSLDINKNDRIYVGAVGEFGYLEADNIGRLTYKSYLNRIDPADRNFTDVWASLCTAEGVYFFTKNIIFFINDNEVKTWHPRSTSFFLAYLVNQELYVLETGYGLMTLNNNDELELIPGGERFKNDRIYSVQQYDSEKIIIATRNQGLVFYDSINGYLKFSTEADDFLKSNLLYSCKILPNNKIVLGTLLGGVAIINKDGKLIQILNKNSGLLDDVIYSTFFDKESNLWLGLSNGISKVEINHPITRFNELNGLKGSIQSLYRFNGTLYVGTFTGTYYLSNNKFIQIPGLADQSWKLTEFTPEKDGKSKLLVGTYSGIYEIKNNKPILIEKLTNCQDIIISKKYENRIYVITGTHLVILEYKNGAWENKGMLTGLNTYMKSIVESNDGSLWISTDIDGIYHLIFENLDNPLNPKINKYALDHGIPMLNNLRVLKCQNNILFGTPNGLYTFNSEKDNFSLDTSNIKYHSDYAKAFYLVSYENNNLWLSDHLNNPQQIGYIKNLNDNPYWYNAPFNRLPEMYTYSIFHDTNNITWIGGSELLFKYDAKRDNLEYNTDFNTLIRKVVLNQDSVICWGTAQHDRITKRYKQKNIPEIEYKNNTIEFHFSAPEFSVRKNLKYQHYLEGYDKKWSSFSNISFKEYTNLPKGNYIFKVRAINTYGQISNEASYQFIILTPWYSSVLAYVIYILLFVVLYIIVVKLNTKRLKAHNKNLEELVRERTSEIREQKDEILAQNEEITAQNEEIFTQKEELENHRNNLEKIVDIRTRELSIAKEKAEESDRLKSSFLSNMSHEIRTPMNAIIGFSSMIIESEITKEQKVEFSNNILNSCDSLLRLVDDIIDIAKLESGQLEIRKRNFDLNNLLDKILEIFHVNKKLIDKDHLELEFDNSKEKEQILIYSDPLRIQQVLSNLINNALKYTEKGFVKIGYDFNRNQKNPLITFYVKDTGIGLTTDQQKIIFSRFTKVEDNKKKLYRGTGLGLAISKSIIELLNGNIWVESEPDHGSTFYFTIPLEIVNTLNKSNTKVQNITHKLDYNWSGNTILIAEDEEDNYRFFEIILSSTHANIIHARNGIEAIKICKEKEIDLVLMDIKMPEMDGLDATKLIKKENKDIPIIALTAFAMENDEKQSLEAGCDAYLSKPVNKYDLLGMINKFFI